MGLANRKFHDQEPLTNSGFGGAPDGGQTTLKRADAVNPATAVEPQNLVNLSYSYQVAEEDRTFASPGHVTAPAETSDHESSDVRKTASPAKPVSFANQGLADAVKIPKAKEEKVAERDFELLRSDKWLVRNGHLLTYALLYAFSVIVLFRPYEILPGFEWLAFSAFYVGVATLAIYFPSQLATEGNLTKLSTEVKAVLAMTLIAFLLIPISVDPGTAWETFNDPFIKAVAIFVVLVNVVRTRRRLMQMMWLSFGIGIYLAACAVDYYMQGKFSVEDYRVAVTDVKGIFGNPNEMALHFVMMTPITLCLALASKNKVWKVIYFAATALFVAANMVTYSRGGFLGLLAIAATLAWKLGRKHKLHTLIGSVLAIGVTIAASPGNYGLRMISIFIPSLDPVGSSDARRELLERSLLVTARNPWGIGIGNFPIVATQNHQTHNAFTQVSSELGIAGFVAYMIFMIAPFRRLRAIERRQFDANDLNWFYFMSIGLQASIVGYWVSSFFASVAYNWFIYYLLAYAVAFRRIYAVENKDVLAEQENEFALPEAATV
ncbi:MAG: O-antigen ligase family protein [Acidobacteria bacterium]|nr:O-antigen ligase family protein [Acidobacteriota bacterium]